MSPPHPATRHAEEAVIVSNRPLGAGYLLLTLMAPRIAASARAGQFALLSCRPAGDLVADPLLGRPFSFSARRPHAGEIDILYRVAGRGTRLLADLGPGTPLDALGPFGNGWPLPTGDAILVAGGVGMPPLLDLAEVLRAADPARNLHVFYGGRSRGHLVLLDRFEAAGVDLHLSTDDGSLGYSGTNVDDLRWWLQGRPTDGAATLFACGPHGMIAAAVAVAGASGVPAWVSLEAPMACGVGVCRGCAVPAAGGGYRMVCSDGPVFQAEEIAW